MKTGTLIVKVTHVVTRPSIQILQQYLIEQGLSDAQHAALNMCTDRVFTKAASKMKTTLDFFVAYYSYELELIDLCCMCFRVK